MKYPNNLIPIVGWSPKIQISGENENIDSFPVARRVGGIPNLNNFSTFDNKLFTIKLDANIQGLSPEDVAFMSMNILSEDCSMNESKFFHKVKDHNGKIIEKWDGGIVRNIYQNETCQYAEPCYFLVYNSRNLHLASIKTDVKMPDRETFNKHFEAIENVVDKIFNKQNEYTINGLVQLCHDPTPLNYWHIVLEVHAPNNVILNKTKNGWKNIVGKEIVNSILRKNVYINNLPCSPLPRAKYQKSSYLMTLLYKIFRYIQFKRLHAEKSNKSND